MNHAAKLTGYGIESNTESETVRNYTIKTILQATHQGNENY